MFTRQKAKPSVKKHSCIKIVIIFCAMNETMRLRDLWLQDRNAALHE